MNDEKNVFFFSQTKEYSNKRRFRKLHEELPECLVHAHLNPKLAAYFASKEKHKQENIFGDGLGKQSLIPEINQAFLSIKNCLNSYLPNDKDSQRFLYDETRVNASNILTQLSQIIYKYKDIASHIPKSLEYRLMFGVKELTLDVIFVSREWQTCSTKDTQAGLAMSTGTEFYSDDEDIRLQSGAAMEGRANRALSISSGREVSSASLSKHVKKRFPTKGLPGIVEDSDKDSSHESSRIRRQDIKTVSATRSGLIDDHTRFANKNTGIL